MGHLVASLYNKTFVVLLGHLLWPFFSVLLGTGAHVAVLEKRRTGAVTDVRQRQTAGSESMLAVLCPDHKSHCVTLLLYCLLVGFMGVQACQAND